MNFRVAILQKKSLTRKYQENTDVILQKNEKKRLGMQQIFCFCRKHILRDMNYPSATKRLFLTIILILSSSVIQLKNYSLV